MLKQLGRIDAVAALAGCGFVLIALVLVWGARGTIARELYVSELGAEGMATRQIFMSALLSLVVGGVLIAWAGRGVRAEVAVLRWWSPSVSLWIASGLFLLASQVTCTYGCPAPVGAAFTWQDLVHTLAAVLAFCFTCLAMLQTAFARQHHAMAALSGVSAWGVAGLAGLGGILGIAKVSVGLGAALEFAAMTVAVGWVVAFGATLALERLRVSRRRSLRTA
ncbi:MAG TPA: DUF998 domain-containing protein [Microbacteriaceae bacterium]|nr:DUF998 domain-containing protein [Microbacteriaceae bacterium]